MSASYLAPEIAEEVEATLSPEEFDRRVASVSEAEIEESIQLIRWFTRRYPTPKARLDFARRMFEQWTRPVTIVKR
jgi:hypothetical protein